MNELEVRYIQTELESVNDDAKTVHGLAVPVNSPSALLRDKNGKRFYEYILPTAITESFINSQDIKLYLNHDSTQGTYGRSKFGEGTLKLSVTERGLEFDVELPNTVFGEALYEGIKRGDFDAVSFCYADKDGYGEPNPDGTYNWYVREMQLLDEISILSCTPAFSVTNVSLRSLPIEEQIQTEEEKEAIISRLNDRMQEIDTISQL